MSLYNESETGAVYPTPTVGMAGLLEDVTAVVRPAFQERGDALGNGRMHGIASGQALMLGAKVTALLAGRYNVAFEDVHAVALAALRHRLLLNFDGLAEGVSTDEVIGELLKELAR